MNLSNVVKIVMATVALFAIDRAMPGFAPPPDTVPAQFQQATTLSQTQNSAKVPVPFAISPAAILFGGILAGTVLVLVSGIGHESLNSIDFERAYRESHKPTTAAIGN